MSVERRLTTEGMTGIVRVMPTFILKPDPDVDLYCEWSTVVDNLTSSGTRAQYAAGHEQELEAFHAHPKWAPERFERADQSGSSALDGSYAWDDTGFIVHNTVYVKAPKWLDRADLLEYTKLMRDGDTETAEGLLKDLQND